MRAGIGEAVSRADGQDQYNLTNAREYFKEHLCVGDYYDEGQRVAGYADNRSRSASSVRDLNDQETGKLLYLGAGGSAGDL